ncbi:glycosyl transferase [Alphaproteobacteria bacterium KMM 3653]|uniref:Peptide O-xylosyltransferase n=1 Tax=Harenicola maris TaxID=2841044 RepID=A0AAP2G9C3_9RHOB|nr:glycosyl transferase [Harenicola maris]
MAKIAFILLCHKDPDAIIAQAESLTAAGDYISIHFDASASAAHFDQIRKALGDNPNVCFSGKRIKCGWGEWSLVQASLYAVEAAVEAFPRATHFYMLSGDCMAIKSAEYAHDFLDRDDVDYIESFDFFDSDWIKTGFKEERLIYRHFVNERTNKWLFYKSFNLQRRLGLTRKVPSDIEVMIGSQWWCLRRRTIEWVLDFTKKRRDVMRFFRTTWIPDETFFQTVVRHVVPNEEIRTRSLTFLMFTDYGMPVTFYNDHFDMLLSQNFLFARKISPEATDLKARLGALYAKEGERFQISGDGRRMYSFLTGRGREGRRFAPRFWETEATLGRDRELMIVICKKWHVAKRLVEQVRSHTNLPAIEYLFNEEATELPDLGGIQSTMAKRTRHRRALLRMLFEYHGTNRMVICLDPANIDFIEDFAADKCTTKSLEMVCEFSDDFLAGHARRVGLAGAQTSKDIIDKLMPTIRYDVVFESERLRDAELENFYQLRETGSVDANTSALIEFLSIPPETAREIATTEHLFAD